MTRQSRRLSFLVILLAPLATAILFLALLTLGVCALARWIP